MSQTPPLTFDEQGPDRAYADYLAAGEFNIQRCGQCQQHVFYPRLVCPHCGGAALSWVQASGEGTVYSTSVPRGGKEGDYNISLIDLAEGPRMMSRVVDIGPDAVAIGMKVQAFIGEIDGKTLILFRPHKDAAA
jgi:uncharacterized OB-fold protein